MKRYQIILLVFGILIVVLWVVGRLTGALQLYSIPTGGMEPTINPGTRIFTTNLKELKRFDIVVYSRLANDYGEPDSTGKKNRFFSRLVALGGDTIQLRDGYLYTNGKYADDSTILKFPYIFAAARLDQIAELLKIDLSGEKANNTFSMISKTEGLAMLSNKQYEDAKKVIELKREIRNELKTDTEKNYPGKNWSIDNFGPFIIPQGHCFFLGDNRHSSHDSRFFGPIPVKDCKGVMIAKF